MRAVVIDAYDSFVHIIDAYLARLGVATTVLRNDRTTPAEVAGMAADFVVLGPGPGHPADAGYVELIGALQGRTPILGVCLGHQAIGLAFGGAVARAKTLMHGKTSRIAHDGRGCFRDQAPDFTATRYHSLAVNGGSLPECLEVSATAGDDATVMGLRHRHLPIESVQFHPESICTDGGLGLFANFIAVHV